MELLYIIALGITILEVVLAGVVIVLDRYYKGKNNKEIRLILKEDRE